MATIKDVARLAGVGLGTASRAISGRGPVAPETLARVQQAVRALDFKPSNVARALSSKSLGMIGVYVTQFEGPFYGPILATIDAELRAVDRHMVVANGVGHGDIRQQALDGIDFLIQRECDGLIVVSAAIGDDDLVALHARFERLVIVNRDVPALHTQCHTTDHRAAGRLAAEALLERGHRAIATIAGPARATDNEARMAAFFDTLAAHGVGCDPALQLAGDFGYASGHARACELIALGGYTALFCANDQMAIAAISAHATAGVRVPQDVSVLGYDDIPASAYASPPLASVHVPIEDLASAACRHLLQQCYGLELPFAREHPSHLVTRASLAGAPAESRRP